MTSCQDLFILINPAEIQTRTHWSLRLLRWTSRYWTYHRLHHLSNIARYLSLGQSADPVLKLDVLEATRSLRSAEIQWRRLTVNRNPRMRYLVEINRKFCFFYAICIAAVVLRMTYLRIVLNNFLQHLKPIHFCIYLSTVCNISPCLRPVSSFPHVILNPHPSSALYCFIGTSCLILNLPCVSHLNLHLSLYPNLKVSLKSIWTQSWIRMFIGSSFCKRYPLCTWRISKSCRGRHLRSHFVDLGSISVIYQNKRF